MYKAPILFESSNSTINDGPIIHFNFSFSIRPTTHPHPIGFRPQATYQSNSLNSKLQNDANDLDRWDIYDDTKSESTVPMNIAPIHSSKYMQRRVDESGCAKEAGFANLCNDEQTDEENDALPKMSRVHVGKP